MAPSKDPSPEGQSSDSGADLAQAYRDLARGEQAATALEANLNNLESKLDALLAAMDNIADDQPGADSEKVKDGDASKDSERKKDGEGKDKSSSKDPGS